MFDCHNKARLLYTTPSSCTMRWNTNTHKLSIFIDTFNDFYRSSPLNGSSSNGRSRVTSHVAVLIFQYRHYSHSSHLYLPSCNTIVNKAYGLIQISSKCIFPQGIYFQIPLINGRSSMAWQWCLVNSLPDFNELVALLQTFCVFPSQQFIRKLSLQNCSTGS